MDIDQEDFDQFCRFLKNASGICLTPNKRYLVTTRIRKILIENDLVTFSEFMRRLRTDTNQVFRQAVIDAMTTNETFWFRDTYPFNYLKTHVLPQLDSQDGTREIRIWSAACSSGQEPYSIAMVVDEYQRKSTKSGTKSVAIIASDLSSSMLRQAREGCYDKSSIERGLSEERLSRYFTASKENQWKINPKISGMIEFRHINMLDSFSNLGRFDIIFCRNVLIYFSNDLKKDVLRRLYQALKPNGFLCLGSSEGLGDNIGLFEMVQCNPGIIYRAC